MTTTETKTGAEEVLWDLSPLYSGHDDPKIDADIGDSHKAAAAFKKRYHGKVASLSAEELFDAIKEAERIQELVYKASVYAYLHFSTNTSEPQRGALLQKMQEAQAALSTELLFMQLEWIAVPDDQAAKLVADPALAEYRHYLESARRYKPHVLTEPEEKILTEKTVSGSSAWSRLFTELTSAIKVKIDGEEQTLEKALSILQRPDRDKRKQAAEAITEAIGQGIRTRAFVFNTLLHDKAVNDRLRGYDNWLSSRNLSNETSDESVQALIDACVDRYDIPQRYYALKAKLLGLDKLADYDRNAPALSEDTFLTWDEAKDSVIDAYQSFSPKAGKIITQFFDENWIDAVAGDDKTPGAYCMTHVPGVHPYVLMSYTGERRAVLTLAHELGHGLHGYLAQDRGLINADTPLTLAETASVFGEALVFKRLLDAETDPRGRLGLLTGRIDDAIATVFRQVAMNRFEDAVHNARRGQGELSLDDFASHWEKTQAEVLGDAVEISDGYKSWWSYIPHFIGSPGYVYAYSFGYLFSLAIFRKYEDEGDRMVDPYLELLSAGGSDTPERLGKIVGLDLTDSGFWAGGLEAVDEVLKEAEALADSV
jgi:oligoendopeptidase F